MAQFIETSGYAAGKWSRALGIMRRCWETGIGTVYITRNAENVRVSEKAISIVYDDLWSVADR